MVSLSSRTLDTGIPAAFATVFDTPAEGVISSALPLGWETSHARRTSGSGDTATKLGRDHISIITRS